VAEITRKELVLALIAAGQNPRLMGLDLSGLDLSGLALHRANLARANLSHANLIMANLFEANLTGANLTGANLSGANLNKVIWSSTNCPDGTNSNNHGNTCLGHL